MDCIGAPAISRMVHNVGGKNIVLPVVCHRAIQPRGITESVAHKAHVHGVDQRTSVGPEPNVSTVDQVDVSLRVSGKSKYVWYLEAKNPPMTGKRSNSTVESQQGQFWAMTTINGAD